MPNIKRRFKDDDPSSDDDDEELEQEVVPSPAGRGKTLRVSSGKSFRAPPVQEDSDEYSDDEDDEDVVQTQTVYRAQGGGKQLRPTSGKQLQLSQQDDDDDDDLEEDDSDDDASSDDDEPTRIVASGGKQFRSPGGGKQLRLSGGKQLVRPASDDSDNDDDSDDEPVAPSGGGGKQLRVTGGKQLRITARGGKQLRISGGKQLRPAVDDDDDDDDEEEEKGKQLSATIDETPAAPSEDDMDMDSSDEEEEEKVAPPPKKPRGRPPKKQPARATKNVAQAVESDDDDDDSSDEEAELDMATFDTQRLVRDEEDQKYLDSLPELEREAILGERFEKAKADMDMKKALKDAKRAEKAAKEQKGPKKRKAATKKAPAKKKAKGDDGTADDAALAKSLASRRESSRNKDATGAKAKKASALAALREERKRAARKDSSDSESSFGDDDDDDSDDDYAEEVKPWQKKTSEPKKSRLDQVEESEDEEMDVDKEEQDYTTQRVVQEAELPDYLKITISRRKLGKWCNEPYFKQAVVGCFAKLFIGENEQGKRCYRLCKIVDIEQAPGGSYQLPAVKKEKPVTTDKVLKLQFGKNERIFPIKLISDNKATESDVTLYVNEMKNQRRQVLSRIEANKIRRKQDDLVKNYTYTTEDIENNLRNRKKKGHTAANLGLEQTRAAIAVQAARAALQDAKHQLDSGDGERSAVLAAEKALEERLEEERAVLEKVKSRKERLTQRSKDKKWAKVNQRALETNQKADLGALKEKESEKAATESGSKPKFNPYARRKVKPKILWEVGQKEETEEAKESEKDTNGTENATEKEPDSTPNLVQEHQEKAAALSQSHQFAIDEEVLAQSSFTNGITGLSVKKPVKKRVRKGLSLTDYLEKKAAGTL